jgi:hypothetical protein
LADKTVLLIRAKLIDADFEIEKYGYKILLMKFELI